MRSFFFLLFIFFALSVTASFAQGGGKAEPLRIEFAKGKSSKVLTGTLTNGEEMEYVFAARKDQTVTVKNAKSGLFDFKVFSEENFSEGDFDSSPTYTFAIPETGDYDLFIRKKQVKTPRRAAFSITLIIK
jgi:hypothetical protein